MTHHFRNIIKTRISQKIIAVVVASIICSGTAFMTPELMMKKSSLLVEAETSAKQLTERINIIFSANKPLGTLEKLPSGHRITGYRICDASACQIQHGETITGLPKTLTSPQSLLLHDSSRLEIMLPVNNLNGLEKYITYRIDTALIQQQYWAHFWKITGQVAGISFFAILTAMLTTSIFIIIPTLKLKHRMMKAKKDPNNPTQYLLEVNQKDEIADLIIEFNYLLHELDHYQRRLTQAKQDSDVRWKFAIEGSGDGIWDWNPTNDEVFFSHQTLQNLGYDQNHLIPSMKAWQDLIHPDDRTNTIAALAAHIRAETSEFSIENRIRHRNGDWVWVLSRGMIVTRDINGQPTRVVGTHKDISQQKENESLIWSQANLDPLTGLPNRRMYNKKLRQLTEQPFHTLSLLYLLYIDLDNFKAINDTHGHKIGDDLLIAVALRLRDAVTERDFVSRIGGDEFTIIVQGAADKKELNTIGDKILNALCKPFSIHSNVFYISASIGITSYPRDAYDAETLTMNADQALYASKDNGRNQYTHFSLNMRTQAQQRMATINALRVAISDQQFEVYYQPIIDYSTGLIVKAEALLRWNHPQKGIITPGSIIGTAEDTGLIIDIGDFVFHQAIEQQAQWRNTLCPDFEISINTSPIQYRDNGIDSDQWLSFIKSKGIPYEAVVIEITESLVLDLSAPIKNRLNAFRDCGVKIALDDFGTGYSSLSYLNHIKSDYLKVDYSFVTNILEASHNMALCQKIIDIAHLYNMEVIVEGVEKAGQDTLLKQAGADYGQGFLYSKPVPASKFEELLRQQNLLLAV